VRHHHSQTLLEREDIFALNKTSEQEDSPTTRESVCEVAVCHPHHLLPLLLLLLLLEREREDIFALNKTSEQEDSPTTTPNSTESVREVAVCHHHHLLLLQERERRYICFKQDK
jgi:hypothetical protein